MSTLATDDFFRARLDQMSDLRRPLAVLASRTPWSRIEASLAPVLAHRDGQGPLIEGADLFGPRWAVAGAAVSKAACAGGRMHRQGQGPPALRVRCEGQSRCHTPSRPDGGRAQLPGQSVRRSHLGCADRADQPTAAFPRREADHGHRGPGPSGGGQGAGTRRSDPPRQGQIAHAEAKEGCDGAKPSSR